jgi:hypothetical protein
MPKPIIKKPSPLSTCTYYNEQGMLITTHRMRRLQYKINNNLYIPQELFTEYYRAVMAKLQAMNINVKAIPATPAISNTTSESNLETMRF